MPRPRPTGSAFERREYVSLGLAVLAPTGLGLEVVDFLVELAIEADVEGLAETVPLFDSGGQLSAPFLTMFLCK